MTHSRSGMDGEDIKAALRKAYGPLTRISQQLGVNKNAISSTIRNSRYSIPMEIRIAELLGKNRMKSGGMSAFITMEHPLNVHLARGKLEVFLPIYDIMGRQHECETRTKILF